ncbi:unnamed protein product [Didymodactylos carnosus]|uniref:Uncharacterized protein n=1 Tax=Didymodactylos carnosus TaxID=1234261 RepID=A0A8S2XI35_9BILA|nr:unnamed protein product [Didymodactylos carnosus]CAF4497755.1 unnamed protein product [Didymodactylos carnosus]
MQTLQADKCKSVVKVHYTPTASAKYLSPLDNPLWYSFKEAIRNQHPLTETHLPSLLSQTFHSSLREEISNAYCKCGITYGADVYYDQPS